MRTLICLHFWISRHLLKLKFLESSKNPQALASHRDPLWRIHMFVWDWDGPPTLAQGLFVYQFRISEEGQDQRVYTLFLHAAAGVLPLLNYILELNLEDVFPSKKPYQLSASPALHWSPWSHLGMWPHTNRFLWEDVFRVSNSWFITIWGISPLKSWNYLRLFCLPCSFDCRQWILGFSFPWVVLLACDGLVCVNMWVHVCICFNLHGGISEN